MKKILSLALVAATAVSVAAEVKVTESKSIPYGMDNSGAVEIDINGDGYLDFIASGRMRETQYGRITEDSEGNETQAEGNTIQGIWNPETKQYDMSEFPYFFANKTYFCVCDWNGDGLTDFFAAGEPSQAGQGFTFGFFINDGNGSFTHQPIKVVDAEGNDLGLFDPKVADFADFNSDGLLDIVTAGYKDMGADRGKEHSNAVLINKGNLTFEATNTDLLVYDGDPVDLALCSIKASDLNNDGYAEFLVQGNVDTDANRPTKNGNKLGRTFIATLNVGAEGEGETVLYNLGLADGISHHYGHGDFQVFDYNNDGTPDIFVGGESPNDARGDGQWGYVWQLLQGKIANDGSVDYSDVTSTCAFNDKPINGLNDQRTTAAIDFNGNGLYDLIISGWCDPMMDGAERTQAGWLFENKNGSYATFEHIPGASETSIFFYENGVRGARNMAFTGYTIDPKYFSDDTFIGGRQMVFCANPFTKAARPDAPSVKAEVNEHNITLAITPAASSQANVTYDYYIKNTGNGEFYRGIAAHVGGELDGVRTTVAQGRAFMAKNLELVNIPDGDYEIGVQTVNASMEGSTFAKANVTVGEGSGSVANVADRAAEVVAVEYYDAMGRRMEVVPATGLVIKKEILSNGTAAVSKVIL